MLTLVFHADIIYFVAILGEMVELVEGTGLENRRT